MPSPTPFLRRLHERAARIAIHDDVALVWPPQTFCRSSLRKEPAPRALALQRGPS